MTHSPQALLDALTAAGARLEFVDGAPRLRGTPLPPELLEALREQRAAVVALAQARAAASRDRYGQAPPDDVPRDEAPLPARATQNRVAAYIWRQVTTRYHASGRMPELAAWVLRREAAYFDAGIRDLREGTMRACLDALVWQTDRARPAALEWLAGLEECFQNLPDSPGPDGAGKAGEIETPTAPDLLPAEWRAE